MRKKIYGRQFEIERGGMYNGENCNDFIYPRMVLPTVVFTIFSQHMIEQEDKKDWMWRDPPGTTKTFAEVT
jgi:hypothetical protein